jgi:hypothetical protein
MTPNGFRIVWLSNFIGSSNCNGDVVRRKARVRRLSVQTNKLEAAPPPDARLQRAISQRA